MSSKTNYLNLCLGLAEHSPLHQRHGCVVVKGGKVIGSGFNTHTLAGGALKTGEMRSSSSSDAEMSLRHDEGAFAAIETCGGYINTPLTVHSEMAAIMDVLQKSTKLSSKTSSCEKPASKVSGSKRKTSKKNEAIRVYVERFCERTCFGSEARSMVFNRKDRRNSARYRNYYHEDYYYEPSMSSNQLTAQNVTTTARLEYERNQHRNEAGSSFVKSYETIVRTAKSTSSSRNNEKKAAGQKRVSDPNLLTNRNIIPCHAHTHSVQERMKDPRLRGADLYVARLGRPTNATKHSRPVTKSKVLAKSLPNYMEASTVCSSIIGKATTGSLHDELVNPNPRQIIPTKPTATSQPSARATDSQPCYRCIEYMHSVGITRVFWTDENGRWKSDKVRNLVVALQSPHPESGSVFVTKHEVLLLKRLFDRDQTDAGNLGSTHSGRSRK
ncbi:hypothetical protein BDV97DRAFT_397289 [Delphinella strobiligena]|nr:hypothetical protein BDV97DRAFT_397289 [Delphinella strobiligena]